jgi:hypothetical protein
MAEVVTGERVRAFETNAGAITVAAPIYCNESIVWIRGHVSDEEFPPATADSMGQTAFRLDTR